MIVYCVRTEIGKHQQQGSPARGRAANIPPLLMVLAKTSPAGVVLEPGTDQQITAAALITPPHRDVVDHREKVAEKMLMRYDDDEDHQEHHERPEVATGQPMSAEGQVQERRTAVGHRGGMAIGADEVEPAAPLGPPNLAAHQ